MWCKFSPSNLNEIITYTFIFITSIVMLLLLNNAFSLLINIQNAF
jgi:hypothetical protein